MRRVWLILVVLLAAVFLLRPVCVPLSDAALAEFTVPIDQRTDRDLYLRVFQRRGGQWHQCKTWISRAFFS